MKHLIGRVACCAVAMVLGAGLTQGAAVLAQSVRDVSRIEELTSTAPNRVAFVVGNADYLNTSSLKNPVSDAKLVSKFLSSHGYRVFTYTNLDKLGFEDLLQRAYYEVNADTEVVFYYSGHGLQVAGQNYLLPTNSELDTPYDLPFEAVSLSNIVDIMGSLARTQLYILDSCRENPFEGADMIAGVSEALSQTELGFSTLTAPVNSLISFSSSPGEKAWDGTGDNSPFTGALIAAAQEYPDRSVSQILEDVRRKVFEKTSGEQVPWESSTLVQPIRFGGATVMAQLALDAQPMLGDYRSWLDRAMPEVQVVSADPASQTVQASVIVSNAPLEREVSLEPTLAPLRDLPQDTIVELSTPPASGRLVIVRPNAMRVDVVPGKRFPLSVLEHAVYEMDMPPQFGADSAPLPPPSSDAFVVQTDAGQPLEIQMKIDPNPCDKAAGARLDPQGVGVSVFANELDPVVALPACEAAVAANPQNGRFHFQLGRVLLAMKRNDEAEASFLKAAELGHNRSFYRLGQIAASREAPVEDETRSIDSAEALAYFERGVAEGDPYAFHALGKQLLRHGKTEAERRRGFDLLQRAVETGHTFSMNALGLYYLDKASPEYDPQRGVRYYQESAQRGDIYGYNNMGLAYRDGRGELTADLDKAADFFEKAVKGQHPRAPRFLGLLYVEGKLEGDQPNLKALEQFDTGLDRGDAWSGVNGAWTILNRPVPGYSAQDAGLRAVKSLHLRGDEAATARAEKYLSQMSGKVMSASMQMLINETIKLLEKDNKSHPALIEVDGAFGAGSIEAMQSIFDVLNINMPISTNRMDRARAISQAYWTAKGIRIDTA